MGTEVTVGENKRYFEKVLVGLVIVKGWLC